MNKIIKKAFVLSTSLITVAFTMLPEKAFEQIDVLEKSIGE